MQISSRARSSLYGLVRWSTGLFTQQRVFQFAPLEHAQVAMPHRNRAEAALPREVDDALAHRPIARIQHVGVDAFWMHLRNVKVQALGGLSNVADKRTYTAKVWTTI